MSKLKIESLLYILLLLFALLAVQPVFAHSGQPRLEISVERLNPGGTLQLRGVGFEYENQVRLVLINSTTQVMISFGVVVTDLEGEFTQNVILPTDLVEGVYTVRATTYDHVIFSPSFTVWGVAVSNEEEHGIQDQSDVQFEPQPTFPLGFAPTPIPAKNTLTMPLAGRNFLIFGLIGLAGIGLLFFIFRMAKSK